MEVKKAIIPAAGFGTRMLPATKSIPKEMLPLGDRPAIQHIVEEAVNSGIFDILIITSRTKVIIEDHFDYSPELENHLHASGNDELADSLRVVSNMANITFLRQKEILGLGHAVWCGRNFTGRDPFAVLLGDDVMRSKVPVTKQLINASEKYDACTVGVQAVAPEMISKYCSLGVTKVEESIYDVNDIIEKPLPEEVMSNYAILGRYVLSSKIMDILGSLPAGFGGEIQLTDALRNYCHKNRMMAVDFEGRRYDCGNMPGYMEAVIDFALDCPETATPTLEYIKKIINNK